MYGSHIIRLYFCFYSTLRNHAQRLPNQMLSFTLTQTSHSIYYSAYQAFRFYFQPFRLFSPCHTIFNKCRVCQTWKATRLNETHKIANFDLGHGASIKIGAQILDWTRRKF